MNKVKNMNKSKIAILALTAAATVLLTGCQSVAKYAPYGSWTANVQTLGPVKANSGAWPLSLHAPPPEYTYHSALRSVAHGIYGVPENEIVLGEVTVEFMSELDGTIRSWKAAAIAGRNREASPLPPTVGTPIEGITGGGPAQERAGAQKAPEVTKLTNTFPKAQITTNTTPIAPQTESQAGWGAPGTDYRKFVDRLRKDPESVQKFISEFGQPSLVDSTMNDNPRPPCVTKWLIYDAACVKVMFFGGCFNSAGKAWILVGFLDGRSTPEQPIAISDEEALNRLGTHLSR
jgi:hypothetical protein